MRTTKLRRFRTCDQIIQVRTSFGYNFSFFTFLILFFLIFNVTIKASTFLYCDVIYKRFIIEFAPILSWQNFIQCCEIRQHRFAQDSWPPTKFLTRDAQINMIHVSSHHHGSYSNIPTCSHWATYTTQRLHTFYHRPPSQVSQPAWRSG